MRLVLGMETIVYKPYRDENNDFYKLVKTASCDLKAIGRDENRNLNHRNENNNFFKLVKTTKYDLQITVHKWPFLFSM